MTTTTAAPASTTETRPRIDARAAPTPDHIMQVGMGFWASKTLLSAVELDLFTIVVRGR